VKVFVDGPDLLTWFELHTIDVAPVPTANWMHIEDGEIVYIRVTFDPRQLTGNHWLGPRFERRTGMNRQRVEENLLRLPEVQKQQTWGHPTFRVRDKIFASLPNKPPGTVVLKATLNEQAALIDRHPDIFAKAPRVGRYGWVSAKISRLGSAQLRELVRNAWQHAATTRRGTAAQNQHAAGTT
jgi:hypothetical protein